MADLTAQLVHAKIAAVCPIDGVSIGDPTNAATWSIVPAQGATPAQIQAGQQALAALTPAALATANTSVQTAVAAIPNPVATALATAVQTLPSPVAVPSGPVTA